jgi:hypothetical protein
MRRVATIVCVFLLLVATAAVYVYRTADPNARTTGLVLYGHRKVLADLAGAERTRAQVVWAGDSTLMRLAQYPSYVDFIKRDVLDPAHVPMVMLAAPGIDAYAYWSLSGRIAALHPKLVVLIANLRTFMPEGGVRGLSDLAAEIPLTDLPRTLALPYYIRGMTAPRLVLARALRTQLGEDVFLTFEGVRRDVQESEAWRWLGPENREPIPGEQFMRFAAMSERLLVAFDRPLGPSNPLLRFLAAAVSRMADAGATVLVVVTPMPWERGLETHNYEEGRFAERIALLRDVVESGGGRLVDLHRGLTKKFFRDTDCHLTADGAAEMARLLTPEVRRILTERGVLANRPAPQSG